MSTVIIQDETTKNPISLMGKEAGICWGADVSDIEKNKKRGLQCVKNDHGRVLEYPQIYMVIDGYSSKVMREYYTHIGGMPSRLQESTRYIDYKNFKYEMPASIERNELAAETFTETMNKISEGITELLDLGIPNEDATMMLPLAMETKVVVRTDLRNLVDMAKKRLCNRAYHEYRLLMHAIIRALSEYSEEWNVLINEHHIFKAQCEILGYCPESKGACGRYPKKENK